MIEHQDPNIQIAILTQKVEVLETMVERQTKQVEELVQAWQAASTMVGFIKMLGGIALADANYSFVAMARSTGSTANAMAALNNVSTPAANNFRVYSVSTAGSGFDSDYFSVVIFR